MKIGILTYWGVANYGAWVQAYALNHVVRELEMEENEVLHINYLDKIHWDMYYKTDTPLCNAFSYSWNEIPHTGKMMEGDLEQERYDVLITGSDSIWEFSNFYMGNDRHMIGNNLNTKKLVAYAASFGVTDLCDLEKWAKEGLANYDMITVRDEHSKQIVDELIEDSNCKIVLDPALLYDFSMDDKVKEPVYENYIVVYGAEFDDEFIFDARKFAKEKGLQLISVGFINYWCDRSIRMLELRTLEWLGFFKNAEYVFTSTFHGLMVGLSFNKQIKFNQVQYVKNRSKTLLEQLNIENEVKDFGENIAYDNVKFILKNLREKSKERLKEMLGEI